MADNNLVQIVPTLFSSLQKVARELTGFISAVKTDFDSKGAAVGQTISVPVAPLQKVSDYFPGAYAPTGEGREAKNVPVTITKSRESSFYLTGEQEAALVAGGNDNATTFFTQSLEQAYRAMANEVEADLANIYKRASRGFGTPGTTPFQSDLSAVLRMRQILLDNGAPNVDLHLVIDTEAGVNLRSLGQVSVVADAGTDKTLRTGDLLNLHGVQLHESAQVAAHTKGTGSGYTVGSARIVGDTEIPVSAGTGTIVAGDIARIGAAGTPLYSVNDALASGSFKIGNPGVRDTIASGATVTLSDNFRANVALYRDAAVLVARPPMIGDTPVIETIPVTDEVSGLTFLICRCLQDGQITYRVHLAWGYQVVQPEFVAVLMG